MLNVEVLTYTLFIYSGSTKHAHPLSMFCVSYTTCMVSDLTLAVAVCCI